MKIISRYVLREHVGPFIYALTALTSLLLLNFISRQFGELVGKGLPKAAIGEFFLLSIPFTVALTLPMSVLVAVLKAYSSLAAENEVTAFKASGISPWRLVAPSIGAGVVMSLFLLAFNDQVLPRANHRLKTLQEDIAQTKPTFLLKPQVINAVSEGKLYLKAGKIDRGGSRLTEVVIYDLGDPSRRRTIYADSGSIAFAPNMTDLDLELYDGEIQEVATDEPGQLNRLFYERDRIRVKDVAGDFSQTSTDSSSRGDRELGVCAMQKRLHHAQGLYNDARRDYDVALKAARDTAFATSQAARVPAERAAYPETRGIGWAYCTLVTQLFGANVAEAAEVGDSALALPPAAQGPSARARQDTTPRAVRDSLRQEAVRDSAARATEDSIMRAARDTAAARAARRTAAGAAAGAAPGSALSWQPLPQLSGPDSASRGGAAAGPGGRGQRTPGQIAADALKPGGRLQEGTATFISQTAEAKLRLDMATHQRNRYQIEIHKKFALAAACLIFVILGAPIALRFPRGGVGLVLGVSLIVFALYYVGLIGGEALANKGLIPPFWAMWGTNVIMMAVGIVLLFRMGRESNTGRGGDWGDRLDRLREIVAPRRRAKQARAAA